MESKSYQNFYLINLDEVPLRYLRRWFFLPACKLWRSEDTPACRGNVDMRTAKTFDCTLMKWSLSFEKTFLGGFLHCSMMIKKISLSCPPPLTPFHALHTGFQFVAFVYLTAVRFAPPFHLLWSVPHSDICARMFTQAVSMLGEILS